MYGVYNLTSASVYPSKWTNQIIKYWINLTLEYKTNKKSQDKNYFINYHVLLSILNLNFDLKNKKSIIEHIELFGKENTWSMLINYCDCSILDILLE